MIFPLSPPLMDLLILSIVNREESYGYEIHQWIKNVATTKDSTLYPILKKLSDNGYVVTYDRPFQGRNRKYYNITTSGKEQLHYLKDEWNSFSKSITFITNIDREMAADTAAKAEPVQSCEEVHNDESNVHGIS